MSNLQIAVELLRKVRDSAPDDDTTDAIDAFIERMEQPIVKVARDEDPENPFTAWDCEPPIIVAYPDHGRLHMRSYGVPDELPHLDRMAVLKHWREMIQGLGYAPTFGGLRHLARDRFDTPLDRCIAYALAAHYDDLAESDKLSMLADAYRWLGIPCHLGSTTGYVQGDYAEVLVVATPEWQQRVGAPDDSLVAQCEGAVKLYGYWAWGDVWGYTIETQSGEYIESCWGFYGDDLETTGMLDAVEAKYHDALRQAWERRFQ